MKNVQHFKILILLSGIFFVSAKSQSQGRMTREEYISTYKNLAISEMRRTGIPASITMAQACLESGDGNSRLAKKANNHFGIKCHNNWQGKKIYHDDDEKNECFRKYSSVQESFRDHSNYLTGTPRYGFLFDLNPTDYKAWARGLKKAGYATNNNYANALIKIIEEYKLYELDDEALKNVSRTRTIKPSLAVSSGREIYERNRIKYIITRSGDSFENLTKEFMKLPWELPRYNDLPADTKIDSGQIIYLQPKRNSAEPGKHLHTIKEGETMYSISQLYGIKLEKLYEKNLIPFDSVPAPGTVLQLRKSLRTTKLQVKPIKINKPATGQDEEEMKFKFDEN
jgi:hypothetical protein